MAWQSLTWVRHWRTVASVRRPAFWVSWRVRSLQWAPDPGRPERGISGFEALCCSSHSWPLLDGWEASFQRARVQDRTPVRPLTVHLQAGRGALMWPAAPGNMEKVLRGSAARQRQKRLRRVALMPPTADPEALGPTIRSSGHSLAYAQGCVQTRSPSSPGLGLSLAAQPWHLEDCQVPRAPGPLGLASPDDVTQDLHLWQ